VQVPGDGSHRRQDQCFPQSSLHVPFQKIGAWDLSRRTDPGLPDLKRIPNISRVSEFASVANRLDRVFSTVQDLRICEYSKGGPADTRI